MAARSTSLAPVYRVGTEGILDAATSVFASEGYDRANMDTIAARAGITKPTLYARFGSKEGLFAVAVQREYDVRKARLFDAYSKRGEEPFRTRLHRWSSAYFDLVRERPAGFALITEGERHPGAAALVRQGNEEIVDRIAGLVVEVSGRRAWQGARLVAAMISGIFTACAREAVAKGMDLDDAAVLCESFMLGALRGVDPKLIDNAG
ncbi:MAG TPA: TetR/AcrR family transcriptional regulator [Solirubrobacteraceae bacterium]|jgi:AcrR family transcriptional regulator